jgi:ABC-type multidrug transport system permease subunit
LERIYSLIEDDFRTIVEGSLVGGFLADMMEMPVIINTERLYNPELRSIIGFFPGIAAMVISLPAIALTLAVAREKELGTLEQLVATPISKLGLLLGKITPYLIFGTIDSLVIVAVGVFMFGVPFRGNLLGYTFISFFFMMSNMGLGLLISVMVKSQQLAMIIAFLVFLIPGFFLSGVFFPTWVMPLELQVDLMVLPVTHFVAVSQGMYLQGSTLADLWVNTVALIVLSIVVLGFSMLIFRKKVA